MGYDAMNMTGSSITNGGASAMDAGIDLNSSPSDFLNWSGWNPGVGDFQVVPDPMVGLWGDGIPGQGVQGAMPQQQQEWY
jgi:hypothetical protein